MTASGFVATPNRSASAAPSRYYAGQGGAGGSIATPSRATGVATSPPPPSGGIHGSVGLGNPIIFRDNPFPLFDGFHGWHALHHVRKWTANFEGIRKFLTSALAPTDWTTNRPTQACGTESDPIRVDSRFTVQTFSQEFDTRVYSTYYDRDKVQRDQYLTVSVAKSNIRMASPYMNRLTQWRANAPYAAQTEVL